MELLAWPYSPIPNYGFNRNFASYYQEKIYSAIVKDSRYHHMIDNELLDKYYAENDLYWIGILLERYTLLLLGVCIKYLKDEEEAKDCVQQIFLKVLTEVPKYKIEYFKSWLYMVAKNHCLMKLRASRSRNWKELNEDITEYRSDDNLQQLIDNEHTYSQLEKAVSELNKEQRLCINLFYLQKNSYQQIAEKTGFTPLQVKSYIQNGKRNLKLLLEKKLKQNKANF